MTLNEQLVSVLERFPEKVLWRFARPYVAGETLEDAIKANKRLTAKNIQTTINILGEHIFDPREAVKTANEYIGAIETFWEKKIKSDISVKLSQIGLTPNANTNSSEYKLALSNMDRILETADKHDTFGEIDIEDSNFTDNTLLIFKELFSKYGGKRIGVAIQSYLRRTERDIEELVSMGAPIRVVKGIYIEPEEIAFQTKKEITDNFIKIMEIYFKAKIPIAIATHDKSIIGEAEKMAKSSNAIYEFQTLMGVKSEMIESLAKEHPAKVYVPCGTKWREYSLRRMKENPRIMWYVAKNLARL